MNNLKLLENTRRFRKTPKGVLTNMYQHMKARSIKYGYELRLSLSDIHRLFLTDKQFLKLYRSWVKKGFQYYDKPSIDRINPYYGYEKENVQILSWRDNRTKGNKECATKKLKPIWACDMNGEKIKRFSSIKEAVNKLGLNQGLVSAVLTKKRNHTGGYKFIYENPDLLN